MSREVSDWLSGYLKYTQGSEPPTSYHTWVGVSMIAGTLQRRVSLQWGFEKIHPNMYVVLVGPSGRARKGVAIGIGKDLLSEVDGITVASENATREALIRAMKTNIKNYMTPSGEIKFHCSLTCFSEELSVFLGQNDIKFLASLTDWYDSKDVWTYETKNAGKDRLEGLCFNMLGATAPDWLQSMLPQEAVGGGFTSRVVFVVEEKKGKTVPKHVLTPEELRLKTALVNDLQRISNLVGSFSFTPAGEAAYISWYEQYDKELAAGRFPVEDKRFAGYCERRPTHLRKLMMIMSASRGDSLQMDEIDFQRANELLTKTEVNMKKTFGGLGKAKYANVTEDVLDYIKKMRVVSRSDLLRKFYHDVDTYTMNIIEDVLVQMHVVDIGVLPSSNDKIYKYREDGAPAAKVIQIVPTEKQEKANES